MLNQPLAYCGWHGLGFGRSRQSMAAPVIEETLRNLGPGCVPNRNRLNALAGQTHFWASLLERSRAGFPVFACYKKQQVAMC